MAWVREVNPDVLALQETACCRQAMERVGELFPHRVAEGQVLSHWPVVDCHRLHPKVDEGLLREYGIRLKDWLHLMGDDWQEMPIWCVTLDVDGRTLRLICCYMMSTGFNRARYDAPNVLHRLWLTWKYDSFGKRARLVGADVIVNECSRLQLPTIVCGDMNDFAYSKCLRRLMLGCGLRNAWDELHGGKGWFGRIRSDSNTFESQGFHLRLDHFLIGEGITPKKIEVMKAGFSDHHGLVLIIK